MGFAEKLWSFYVIQLQFQIQTKEQTWEAYLNAKLEFFQLLLNYLYLLSHLPKGSYQKRICVL